MLWITCCIRCITCFVGTALTVYVFTLSYLYVYTDFRRRVSYITTRRLFAGAILLFVFLWLIPWRDIGNNKINTVIKASKDLELQEPEPLSAITRV